jgi:hypothetical protein
VTPQLYEQILVYFSIMDEENVGEAGIIGRDEVCIILLTKRNTTLSNSKWTGRDLNRTVLLS